MAEEKETKASAKKKKPAKKKPKRNYRTEPVTFEEMGDCQYIRRAALKKYGLTPDVWAGTLKAELEATKVKVFMTKDGEIIKSEEFVDHKIRQAARQDLGEYLGIKPPQEIKATVQGVKFIIED